MVLEMERKIRSLEVVRKGLDLQTPKKQGALSDAPGARAGLLGMGGSWEPGL